MIYWNNIYCMYHKFLTESIHSYCTSMSVLFICTNKPRMTSLSQDSVNNEYREFLLINLTYIVVFKDSVKKMNSCF